LGRTRAPVSRTLDKDHEEAHVTVLTTRPTSPSVNPERIPAGLKALDQWVGWRYQLRQDEWAKTPIRCKDGRLASSTDPATWVSFPKALDFCRRRKPDGVGFVFSSDDPFTGVDLDDCRDLVSGRLEPWAEEVVRELDSYTEVSPSGTGVKIFLKGELPPGSRNRKGKLEVYSEDRFFTVTGGHLAGTLTFIEDRQEAFQAPFLELAVLSHVRHSHTTSTRGFWRVRTGKP
jgi:primase-polymerase (primpol)-like protein